MASASCKDCHTMFNGMKCPSCGSRRIEYDEVYPEPEVSPIDKAFEGIFSQLEGINDTIVSLNQMLRDVQSEIKEQLK